MVGARMVFSPWLVSAGYAPAAGFGCSGLAAEPGRGAARYLATSGPMAPEDSMRKLAFTIAAGAVALAGAAATAQAAPAVGAEALRTALADAQPVEKVHCVPGWWHHSKSGDGCKRRSSTRYYYQPYPYSYSPYVYGGYPYSYGYPYHYGYGPGIGFSFRIR
jgi:hypothetical protein